MPGWVKRETIKRLGITTAEENEAVMTTRGIRRSSIHTERSEVLCAWGWTKGHLGVGSRLAAMPPTWGVGDIKGETRVSGVKNLGAALACYPGKVALDGPLLSKM